MLSISSYVGGRKRCGACGRLILGLILTEQSHHLKKKMEDPRILMMESTLYVSFPGEF